MLHRNMLHRNMLHRICCMGICCTGMCCMEEYAAGQNHKHVVAIKSAVIMQNNGSAWMEVLSYCATLCCAFGCSSSAAYV